MSQQSLQEVAQDVLVDEALVEEIVEAFNVGNVDTIVDYFHEDGVFQVARGPAPTGVSHRGQGGDSEVSDGAVRPDSGLVLAPHSKLVRR